VTRGESTAEDVVLGDWNLVDRDIDPGRVAAVLGSREGRIVAAFAVDDAVEVDGYDRPRVRFRPVRRLHHMEGLRSPYRWKRGELYPVAPFDAANFNLDGTDAPAREVELGGFVLAVDDSGDATVLAPAGRSVTVRAAAGGVAGPGSTADYLSDLAHRWHRLHVAAAQATLTADPDGDDASARAQVRAWNLAALRPDTIAAVRHGLTDPAARQEYENLLTLPERTLSAVAVVLTEVGMVREYPVHSGVVASQPTGETYCG
jgi:hypothetical protein